MKKYFSYTFFLFLLAVPSVVHACSCAHRTPGMAFNEAKAVFIGKMTGGTEKNTLKDSEGKEYTIESGKVGFTVEETFKGKLEKTVTVQVASMKGTSCGTYGLVPGETYVVYAYATDDKPAVFSTGVCTRTRIANAGFAAEDMSFLRSLPPAGSGGSITGRIWLDTQALSGGGARALPGIKVRITGPSGKTLTVVTNKEGEFGAAGLPAGAYKVEPVIPANYHLKEPVEEVTVGDLGTATTAFEVYYNGRIAGRMVDKNGTPYNGAFLKLKNSGTHMFGHAEGKNGNFDIEGVPPGEYILFIQIHHEHSEKNRDYFYPGTYDPLKAKKIKVGMGETALDLKFTLPAEFTVRKIEGQVFWADGRPAAGVEVNLLCPESAKKDGYTVEDSPASVEADDEGKFVIEGFAGSVYWIEARARKGDEYLHSPANQIRVSQDMKDVKLILSEDGLGSGCGTRP